MSWTEEGAMAWFGLGRGRAKKTSTEPLTADLLAGGVRADKAVAFLASELSNRLRAGGEAAIEAFAEWYERLKKLNEETGRKFAATALPMLPPATRQRIVDKYGIESEPEPEPNNGNIGTMPEPVAADLEKDEESVVAERESENEFDGLRREFAAGGDHTFFAAKRLYERHEDILCGPRDEALDCFWADLKFAMEAGGEKAKDEFIKWCFMTMRDETMEEIQARIKKAKNR
jgi:hypothetical protein